MKTRYVLEYSITCLKENNFGVAEGVSRIASSSCEINKEDAAKFTEFVVGNGLTEFSKAKAKVVNE